MNDVTTMTAETAKDFRFGNSTESSPTIFPSDIELEIVSENERMDFLPNRFLHDIPSLIRFENWLYNTAEELSEDYQGGYWEMAKINFTNPETQQQDSIFFMYPETEGNLTCTNAMNFSDGVMDAKTFGFICTIFTFGRMMTRQGAVNLIANKDWMNYVYFELLENSENAFQILTGRKFVREVNKFIDQPVLNDVISPFLAEGVFMHGLIPYPSGSGLTVFLKC